MNISETIILLRVKLNFSGLSIEMIPVLKWIHIYHDKEKDKSGFSMNSDFRLVVLAK